MEFVILNSFRSLTVAQRSNLLVLFAAGLLFWASLTMFLPTLSLYLDAVGGTPGQVGQVMGGFTIGLLLFRPRLANLADRRGRKPALLIGAGAVAIAPLGYALTHSLALLFCVRVFHGISVAALTLAYSALVADIAPLSVRTEVISYMSLTTPVGMCLGPALGSTLLDLYGFMPLFLTSSVLGGLSFGLALLVQEPDQAVLAQNAAAGKMPFWSLLRSPAVHIPTLMLLLIGLAFGNLMTFTALYFQSESVPLKAGYFFSAAAIMGFVMRVFAGLVARRLRLGLLMSLGIVAYGVAMVILFVARSPQAFLLAAMLEGGGFGLVIPCLSVMLADRSRPEERGRIFGICLLGLDLGGAIAAPLFGHLAGSLGYRPLFAISASMVLLALILFATRSSQDLSHSLRFALGLTEDVYALDGSRV